MHNYHQSKVAKVSKNKFFHNTCIFSIVFLGFISSVFAAQSNITKGISSEGSCAVVGMTAEQCQLLALQRARASAIEQASGVAVSSSTVVTNGMLAVDFIKTYSKGYIVNEKVEWLPLSQYQKDKSTAPIPEYRVKIIADVYSPEKKIKPLGLNVKLNSIIDACFSGNSDKGMLFKNISPAMVRVKKEYRGPQNASLITSAAMDQVSTWYPEKKYSLFTYYFLKGIQGWADADNDMAITIGEIKDYLKENVPDMARRLNNVEQNPVVDGNEKEVLVRISK